MNEMLSIVIEKVTAMRLNQRKSNAMKQFIK